MNELLKAKIAGLRAQMQQKQAEHLREAQDAVIAQAERGEPAGTEVPLTDAPVKRWQITSRCGGTVFAVAHFLGTDEQMEQMKAFIKNMPPISFVDITEQS